MLTEQALIEWLVQCQHVAAQDLVDHCVDVTGSMLRNQSFTVTGTRGPSLFVKHGFDAGRRESVAREAAFVGAMQERPSINLRRFLPRLLEHEPIAGSAIYALIPGASSLYLVAHRRRHVAPRIAERLGGALAVLHRTALDCPQAVRPWVLEVHRMHLADYHTASAANLEFMRIMQQFPAIGLELDRLHAAWVATTLTHNDLKWDNVIISSSSRHRPLALVDWEQVGLGDPGWDLGCVFAEFLAFWVSSIPYVVGVPVYELTSLAARPIETLHPGIASFWEAYIRALDLSSTDRVIKLRCAAGYCAARLIQIAYERQQFEALPTVEGLLLLQLSLNMMQHPDAAITQLLGLTPTGSLAGSR